MFYFFVTKHLKLGDVQGTLIW